MFGNSSFMFFHLSCSITSQSSSFHAFLSGSMFLKLDIHVGCSCCERPRVRRLTFSCSVLLSLDTVTLPSDHGFGSFRSWLEGVEQYISVERSEIKSSVYSDHIWRIDCTMRETGARLFWLEMLNYWHVRV